jgi:hypothetical protein
MSEYNGVGSDLWYAAAAKSCYEAYGHNTGNKNYQGGPMPAFEALPQKIQVAWEVTARHMHAIAAFPTATYLESAATDQWAGWLPPRFQPEAS